MAFLNAHTRYPESCYKLSDELDRFLSNPVESTIRTMKKFDNIMRMMDRDVVGNEGSLTPSSMFMDVDIVDDGEVYKVNLDIPGVDKSNIDIEIVDSNLLRVTAERKSSSVDKQKNFVKKERSYGKFSREFGLPTDSDLDTLEAKYNNGVLTIIVPKHKASVKNTKKINIA